LRRANSSSTFPESAPMKQRSMRGFSLLEMMVVVGIIFVASAIFFMSIQPGLKQARITNSYNLVLNTMRRARESSIAERRVYMVTFTAPRTMTITQTATGIVTNTFTLPSDISFDAEPGIPNSAATTPDHFGTASTAIDFDQGVTLGSKTTVYFQPDGSAQDINSNTNNGVVYIARVGDISSSRAITLWGSTGRLRGWRLYKIANVQTWRQQ
jgi:prepilin-type N-terminal cleavage/methylation domain-containing protein